MVSVVVPAFNAAATVAACIESALASAGVEFEVIVADDGSADRTREIAAALPCRVLALPHRGAAATRNAGAAAARGDVLFFTDADCLLEPGTLARAAAGLARLGPRGVLGGTYAVEPADPGFLSRFQAVFINCAETRRPAAPDYVATHALAIAATDFRDSGGFDARFPLPILEDVEYSHRVKRAGFRLAMDPLLQVRHRFGFTLGGSLRNAARKARFWVRYSAGNRDLLAESGTASRGLKVNGAAFLVAWAGLLAAALAQRAGLLVVPALAAAASVAANRDLLGAFLASHGPGFALRAALYYLFLYPAGVWAGAAAGAADALAAGLLPGRRA
jgi:glycosyltransferase involved in cell wall biosynthesis